MIIWHCRSQLKNVDSSAIWTCPFGIPVRRSTLSTFFSWLRQCQVIMKSFCSCISLRMMWSCMAWSVAMLFKRFGRLSSKCSQHSRGSSRRPVAKVDWWLYFIFLGVLLWGGEKCKAFVRDGQRCDNKSSTFSGKTQRINSFPAKLVFYHFTLLDARRFYRKGL